MQPKRLLAASLGLALFLGAAPAWADASLEYAVKAAYLTKFIPFIDWPAAAFTSATSPVTVCVLGDNPFGGRLEQAAGGMKVGERAVLVRHLTAPDPACQILFLGLSDPAAADAALEAMKAKPVVTVTDSGLKAHGVISFIIDDNHVRFDIDDVAAAQDGLTISSKLLGLAHAVRQRGQP